MVACAACMRSLRSCSGAPCPDLLYATSHIAACSPSATTEQLRLLWRQDPMEEASSTAKARAACGLSTLQLVRRLRGMQLFFDTAHKGTFLRQLQLGRLPVAAEILTHGAKQCPPPSLFPPNQHEAFPANVRSSALARGTAAPVREFAKAIRSSSHSRIHRSWRRIKAITCLHQTSVSPAADDVSSWRRQVLKNSDIAAVNNGAVGK